MQISEKILLIITALITAVAALFCVIALGTSNWTGIRGLYCSDCPPASAGLSIIAFILLIIAVIILILLALQVLPNSLRFIAFIVLFLATTFTLSSYAAYFDRSTGYSFKLMVCAHFLCYIASLFATFWLGGSYVARVVSPDIP